MLASAPHIPTLEQHRDRCVRMTHKFVKLSVFLVLEVLGRTLGKAYGCLTTKLYSSKPIQNEIERKKRISDGISYPTLSINFFTTKYRISS